MTPRGIASDAQLVIYRRPTPSGRHTYWLDHPDIGEQVRVSADNALRMVSIGKARFAVLPDPTAQ